MRRSILLISLWLFTLEVANAFPKSCWIISDLHGHAMYQKNGYTLSPDKISNSIRLIFDGDKAQASGDEIPLLQLGQYMAVGVSTGDAFTTSETYQIDPILGISLYTKMLAARGPFTAMTGTKMFRGKATRCK